MIKKQDLVIETFPTGFLECNTSFVYDKTNLHALLIDPGMDLTLVMNIIEEKKLVIDLLLHTHAHYDHIGISKKLRDKLGAPVYLHLDDSELYEKMFLQSCFFGTEIESGKADHHLQDGEWICLNEKKIFQVVHTPGHSKGSCCFYTTAFEQPVLFSGDTLFKNSIGRTDFPGGDYLSIIHSIMTKIVPLPEDTVLIPGHGANSTLKDEAKNNPFISEKSIS